MTRTKAISAGLLAGFVAAVVITTAMFLLATLGIATPLVIIGDRLSVFIPPGPFLSLMGKVGGYNHLKQLGVGSTIAGQLVVGAIGGAIFGWFARRKPGRIPAIWTMSIFVVLPIVIFAIALWPVLGHELHRPPDSGRAARHTHRLRIVRPFVRTNASNWLRISDYGTNRWAATRSRSLPTSLLRPSDAVHSYWALLVSQRLVAECAGAQTVSRGYVQLRRHPVQRQHRPADYT